MIHDSGRTPSAGAAADEPHLDDPLLEVWRRKPTEQQYLTENPMHVMCSRRNLSL